ncbi:Putative NADH-dependent flavin oxidoreductase yqiG [Minicystis rosea]|nr:Putative NADH-dependent flavin oxidoreductase yqiG [Minicystis rosea]
MPRVDLSSPLTFRNGRIAKNRVSLAPLTNGQSHADGSLGEDELRWLASRARGGFGVVETCAAHVALDGQGFDGELGVFDDRLLPGLTRLASAIREHDALGLVQLYHGGARSPARLTGQRAWSASEIPGDAENPRAATRDDLDRTLAAFRDAAVRSHRAGFDGVELHGAHGYLLGQFLSNLNTRSDGYGGASLADRARFVREVTRAVRAAVPASFIVGIRISPEDWGQTKGVDLDETLEVARWLCEDGIDFLHLSLWRSANNTVKHPDEHPIPLFRAVCPKEVPILVAGSIWTRAEADALFDKGADMVALGRAAITNPDWPLRATDPTWEPRRPPLTPVELSERGLGDAFIGYMRRWKGFVAE